MTDDEFFTAVYLVCGALPSKPEKQRQVRSMATMYRRKLPNNMEQNWLVDDEAEYDADPGRRAIYDPAYMDYFDKAAKLGITMQEFSRFIAWAETHEQKQ